MCAAFVICLKSLNKLVILASRLPLISDDAEGGGGWGRLRNSNGSI